MLSHTHVVISAVLCNLVSFSSAPELTVQNFDQDKCSILCTNLELKKILGDVCVSLEGRTEMRGLYDSRKNIEKWSKCKKNVGVELNDEQEVPHRFQCDEVVVCWLGAQDFKCITKGIIKNTIYVYDYDKENNVCKKPIEFAYNFPITVATTSSSWEKFFSFFRSFKLW